MPPELGGRHAQDLVPAVGAADRRPLLRGIGREVRFRDEAAARAHLLGDEPGRLPLVEAVGALGGDALERPREIRLLEEIAGAIGDTVLRELGEGSGVGLERGKHGLRATARSHPSPRSRPAPGRSRARPAFARGACRSPSRPGAAPPRCPARRPRGGTRGGASRRRPRSSGTSWAWPRPAPSRGSRRPRARPPRAGTGGSRLRPGCRRRDG